MTIDDLLMEFGSRSGMGPLRRNEAGLCRLVFDESYIVDIEAVDAEIRIAAIVGPLDEDVGVGSLKNMLSANLMGVGAGGATLALDDEAETVVICRCLPAEGLSYTAFEGALQGLVNGLQDWREQIQRDASETVRSEAPSLSDDEMFVVRV